MLILQDRPAKDVFSLHSPACAVTHQNDKFNYPAHMSQNTQSILEFLWKLSAVQSGYIFCKVRWYNYHNLH